MKMTQFVLKAVLLVGLLGGVVGTAAAKTVCVGTQCGCNSWYSSCCGAVCSSVLGYCSCT
jgi:hypothetical protein